MICLSLHRIWDKVAGSVNEIPGLVFYALVKKIKPYFVIIATAVICNISAKQNKPFLKRES